MYEVQLNAYAVIGEQKGFAPVSGLALVYTEPVTDDVTSRCALRCPINQSFFFFSGAFST